MRVLLAPMEGVLDSLVRELLTEVNDYDLCITEFVRVVSWSSQLVHGERKVVGQKGSEE